MVNTFEGLLTGPAVMFLILGVLALESAAIVVLGRRRRERGPRPLAVGAILANLGAGAALVAAMIVIVTDGAWPWIGFWLTAAFFAHLVDLRQRLR